MQFDTGLIVHCVLDDTQQALVSTFANNDRLSNQLVATEITRRCHSGPSVAILRIQSRVQPTKIWALCLCATTLRSHCDNV
jgi:hypothetical protein